MKCLIAKLFGLILIQGFACVARNSGKIIESSQSVDEPFNAKPNDTTLSDNYEYLYKTNGQSANYLNYRAVYGLRYKQTQKPMKNHTSNYNLIANDKESEPSETISNEVISAHDDEAQSFNDSIAASSSVESEILATHVEAAESLGALLGQNYNATYVVEPAVDESRKHIMRPNNRVEYGLDFLAERLKKLLYHSMDKTRPESKISPHLSTLGRFLNLFALIQLDSVPCLSAKRPLRQLSGTCYSENDCLHMGGIAVDRCANNLGVCCIFKGGCSSVTNQNVTYFESPAFPLPTRSNLGTCTLTILIHPHAKQILVEFLFFELLPPTDGDCLDDKFFVTGQAANNDIPIICGIATGQHMFIDVGGSNKMQFGVVTRTNEDRAFSIKVTQLRDPRTFSPSGCFQYHTNSEGIIKTFNYDDNSQIQLRRVPSYFNNINYSICIARVPGFCAITYTNEINEREDEFGLVNLDEDGNVIPGRGQAGAEIFSCQDDFIAVNYIRLCGNKLNDGSVSTNFNLNIPIRSYMNGPIVIPFKTNNNTVGRGFQIYFYQTKCSP